MQFAYCRRRRHGSEPAREGTPTPSGHHDISRPSSWTRGHDRIVALAGAVRESFGEPLGRELRRRIGHASGPRQALGRRAVDVRAKVLIVVAVEVDVAARVFLITVPQLALGPDRARRRAGSIGAGV